MKYVLILLFSICCNRLMAQEFSGNSSAVKWLQINTDTVNIIFPKGMEANAMHLATVVHAIQRNDSASLGAQLKKINLVIQNEQTFSNAYVGLAPWRSEFYTTPPQNPFELGANNWIDNLAIHEFRHVHQYANFNKGFSKFASFILGEQGRAVANSAAIPDWFFEGDAVYNETKYSKQGRGTLPLFFSGFQSLYKAGKAPNYQQLRNGSFVAYMPNRYELGYLLVSYGRGKYGDSIWKTVSNNAARFKPLVYPFQQAFKNATGIAFNQFVFEAKSFYQTQWKEQNDEPIKWLTSPLPKDVVDYKYPYAFSNESLIILKKSYKKNPAFFIINQDQSETKIANQSIATDDYFSYNNGKIIYAADQPDIRWGNRAYKQLKLIDVTTKEEKTIVKNTKYFSPDISHNGLNILAVELPANTGSSIVLMDLAGNKINSNYANQLIYANPKFSANDQCVYYTARNQLGEMALLKKELNHFDTEQIVLNFSNALIGFLTVQSDTLIFTTTNQGRDEIWAYIDGVAKKGPFKLATYSTGLYQGVIRSNGTIVASVFTASGYQLGQLNNHFESIQYKNALTDLYVPSIYKKSDQQLLVGLIDRSFEITNYSKSYKLFNFHSWRPMYEQPEYSFRLYGQNILNTLQSELAYTYNENEGSSKIGYDGIYGAHLLQPVFGMSQTWNRSAYLNKDSLLHWNETNAYLGIQLPLNFSGGQFYRYLTVSSSYHLNQVNWTGIGKQMMPNAGINFISSSISFISQIQKAKQQIYPHWGQRILLQYKQALGNSSANQILLSGSYYLPGLFNNHSFVVTGSYQVRDTLQQYTYSNNFPFSRGYTAIDFPSMWKLGLNYHLPIAYPDWGFGNLVYFSRIRANAFFDFTEGKSLRTGKKTNFRTVGAEIHFDTRWWNQQPVSFGIRYSHLLDLEYRGQTQPNIWEFIVPVNLF